MTKAQLDASVANISTNAYNITLRFMRDFSSPGSVTSLDANTSVAESIDGLNEVTENIGNNTYVKSVDASTSASSGGNPLSVTLTISSVGLTQMDIQLIEEVILQLQHRIAHQVIHMEPIQIRHMM